MSAQSESWTARFWSWAPWVSGLVLLAGAVTALVVFVGKSAESEPEAVAPVVQPGGRAGSGSPSGATAASGGGPAVASAGKKVPLDPEAREVAGRFILTAVTRQNLPAAWKLAGPDIRQGITYEEWLTGNIPVDYYPPEAIDVAPMAIQESYRNEAFLEVALLAKKGAKVRSQFYVIGLKAIGKGKARRWVVNYFAPRASYGRFQDEGGAR